MHYKFLDIENQEMYKDTRVMFTLGQYPIFNNIVLDKIKESCTVEEETDINAVKEIMAEFRSAESLDLELGKSSNTLDFDSFLEMKNIPCLQGKWFCSITLNSLSAKQKDKLMEYIKNPSTTGILVVNSLEWKEYREFLKNRIIGNSKYTHAIQLSFPNNEILKKIVKGLFLKNDIKVVENAIDLFIMRMSRAYDSYKIVIDDIVLRNGGGTISYERMIEYLKGVDNFVVDDFILQLMKPLKSNKVVSTRKIYKMYGALKQDMGSKDLVTKIKYRIQSLIEMRIAINNGIVPIMVRYSSEKAKEKLPDTYKIKNESKLSFKRTAWLASRTSLKDLYYIYVMLNSAKGYITEHGSDDSKYDRILIDIMHRSVYQPHRLLNIMGIKNMIEEELYDLNSLFLNENYVLNTREIINTTIGGIENE